jgi:putative alpha-1,2-mannosidase
MTSANDAYKRSHNYQVLWNKDMSIFCPKSSTGELQCPRTPISPDSWQMFTEGDALHWSWYVPHDPVGLMNLYDSPAAFDASLRSFLDNHVSYQEKLGSAAPNPYYWAGNEHDFLAPWLFSYGPNCTSTQYWTRRLTQMHFSNTPHGIPGNDDYGSMSTWLLYASLGIYPQAGSTRYILGSPRVAHAMMTLQHWKSTPTTLEIVTYNNDNTANVFVEKLLVNGVEWTQPFIDRSMLTNTANVKLEFYMHSAPTSGLCA